MKDLALTVPTYGDIAPPPGVPTGGKDALFTILRGGVTILLIVAILLALVFLIFSGIQWILAGGDKQKIEAARNRIIYAIVGLIVALLGFFILSVIGNIFGGTNLFAS